MLTQTRGDSSQAHSHCTQLLWRQRGAAFWGRSTLGYLRAKLRTHHLFGTEMCSRKQVILQWPKGILSRNNSTFVVKRYNERKVFLGITRFSPHPILLLHILHQRSGKNSVRTPNWSAWPFLNSVDLQKLYTEDLGCHHWEVLTRSLTPIPQCCWFFVTWTHWDQTNLAGFSLQVVLPLQQEKDSNWWSGSKSKTQGTFV